MANLHQIITLGIGTPADIPHFVLQGLSVESASFPITDAYQAAVMALEPIAYWRMNEADATGLDVSGNSHYGTYQNAVTQQQTGALVMADTAVEIDNATDPLTLSAMLVPGSPSGVDFVFTTDITQALWLKIGVETRDDALTMKALAWRSALGFSYIGAFYVAAEESPTGQAYWAVDAALLEVSPGSSGESVTTTDADGVPLVTILPDVWYFVVVTFDGTTQRLYVNGTLVNSQPLDPGGSLTFGADGLVVGGSDHTPFQISWTGGLDEVVIWDTVLTVEQIAALYAVGAPTVAAAEAEMLPVPHSLRFVVVPMTHGRTIRAPRTTRVIRTRTTRFTEDA